MEENIIDDNVILESNTENTTPKTRKTKYQNTSKSMFNQKECEVIAYDGRLKVLDVRFGKYGIRIKDVENFTGNTAIVKYKGEIGSPNFEYQLLR